MSDKPVETPAPAADAKPVEVPVEETKTETAPVAAEAPATVEAAAEAPAAAEAAKELAPVAEEAKEAEPAATETKAAEPVIDAAAETKAAETEAAEPAAEPAAETKPAEAAAAATEAKAAEPAAEAAAPTVTPIQALYAAAKENGHPEIWGVTLADPDTDVPSQIVFQKFLNANDGDLPKAKDQLLKTLDWRAKTKPLELLKGTYNQEKFEGLGYVTSYTAGETYDPAEPESKETFTWNIYGSTKSIDKTFGDLTEFLNWRTALMELALQELSLPTATKPITESYDPYKIYQVHDYKSISFLRQSSHVKAASSETIKVFAQNYPELLKEKFFVNVPAIMGFVYAFMKLFVAPKTIKKFHPMSNGGALAREFSGSKIKDLGERLPTEYGGKSAELKTLGKAPLLAPAAPAAEEKPAEEKAPEVPAKEEAAAATEAK